MTSCNWMLTLCGINHKSSSIEQRESLQLNHDEMIRANAVLCSIAGVMESSIISTCNRVEFYLVTKTDIKSFEVIREFYLKMRDLDIAHLEECFYHRSGHHVANHIYRVIAGIESMVLGENQIVGQTREAYASSCGAKSAGKIIHHLFHQAFRVGKQVRTDTEIGKGACSVSTATLDMLKSKILDMNDPTILFIGINQMIKLSAEGLRKRGYGKFIFANRTEQKAQALAARYKCEGYSLENLPSLMIDTDVIICCTGSEKAIITEAMIANRATTCPGKKMVMVDMAIPRDIEMKNTYEGIELYDLEAVHEYTANRQKKRALEIPKAEEMIEKAVEQFIYWHNHVQQEVGGNELGDMFEQIRLQELHSIMESFTIEQRKVIDKATRRIVDKLLQFKMREIGHMVKSEF